MPKKIKEIKWYVNENECHVCVSHCLCRKKNGYPVLVVNGKKYKMHRYVYSKYYLNGNEIPEGFVVRHKCDNTLCINPEHLEIGTQVDNIMDMHKRGRFKPLKGIDNNKAKLSEKQVIEIFNSIKSIKEISEEYKISKSQANLIRNKRGWTHITKDLEIEYKGSRRLTRNEVVEIFYSCDKTNNIALKYGIKRGQVWSIKKRKSWIDITKNLN